MSRSVPEGAGASRGGDEHRLDGVQAVLRLVEDDARRRPEDLVGDLEPRGHAAVFHHLPADGRVLVVERRQAVHDLDGRVAGLRQEVGVHLVRRQHPDALGPDVLRLAHGDPHVTLGVISGTQRAHGEMVAHTMGLVTFSLFDLFFSVTTKDESRTVFTLDAFADKPFAVATGISLASVILATTLDPLEALLRTTPLTVGQWLVCAAVALSIVVVSEMRKAVH
jgi:hypothetical protein